MSTSTLGDPTEIRERTIQATRSLREALEMAIPEAQMKLLTIALAEIAAEETQSNPEFAERLRARFLALVPQPASQKKPNPTPLKAEPRTKLVPLKNIDADRLNPYGIPDPFALFEAFGENQLPLALGQYSLALLNRVAADLHAKKPGTQIVNKKKKDAVITYIVQCVVN